MALPLFPDSCEHELGGETLEKPNLPPRFWQELAANNPLGMQLTEQDVRDWFDLVWLSYSTYGYRRHRRAIIKWWSRVREEEIDRARARAFRIVDEVDTARLEEMAHEDAQADSGVTQLDHFRKLKA